MSEAGAAPTRRSRTPSAEVERELVAAAEVVLVRSGPSGLTVRAVAAEAGIAPMGVYSRLGSKDGLVNALLITGFARLTAALEDSDEPDKRQRLRSCCLRYRAFALDNKHFYALMFEGAIPHGQEPAEVDQHARAAVDALITNVELAAAAGVLDVSDALQATQQIWSALHGAVTLELKGLVLIPDPDAVYRALIETIIRGLARRERDFTP